MTDHEPEFWPADRAFTEAECRELMAGRVPEWLQENARRLIEWSVESGPADFEGMRQSQQRKRRKP